MSAPDPIKGVDFYQAAKPARWVLDEEAVLPSGQRVTGAKARVYSLLQTARDHNHRFPIGRHLAPPGWVPTWVLREVWAGGAAGDRRLRDLREAGVAIDQQTFQTEEDGSSSWVWRLASPGQGGTAQRNPIPGEKRAEAQDGDSRPLRRLSFMAGSREMEMEPDLDRVRVAEVAALAPPAVATPDAYRAHLLDRWRDGTLVDFLEGFQVLAFVFPAGQDELAEVLSRALVALGASRREA
jgi:hypothetical protein